MNLKKLFLASACLSFAISTFASNCLNGSISFNGNASNYYAPLKLSITNNCSSAVNLNGAQITFSNNGQPVSSVWGDYTANNFTQNGFTIVSYNTSTRLNVGATANLNFGINLNNTPFNLGNANSSLQINGSGNTSGSGNNTTTPPSQVIDTPPPAGCVTGRFTSLTAATNQWYTGATLTVSNSCNAAVNLDGASISFKSNAKNLSGPWYPFAGTSYSNQNGTMGFLLSSQNPASNQLNPGASINLSMGINLNGQAFDVTTANATVKVTPTGTAQPGNNDGVIKVTVNPAGASSLAGTTSNITISSPALLQPIVIPNSTWNTSTTYTKSGLGYNTYTITADNPNGFASTATPSTVTLSDSTPANVTVTYAPLAPAQTGTITVTMPQNPIANITDAGMTVNISDAARPANNATQYVNFNRTGTFSNLAAGDIYTISLTPSSLTDGIQTATPTFSANNFKLNANTTQNVNVNFQVSTNPTSPVTFNVSGLTSTVSKVNVNLTNIQNVRVGNLQLSNGSTNVPLPNNTYVGDVDATPLTATITPKSFTVPQTNTVNITVGEMPAYTPELAAYWAGWNGYAYDLNGTYGNIPFTKIYLAFGNFTNNVIDTSVSGWFGNVPTANSQIQPAYQNWTTYAYNHPNTQMILSLGGATFSTMWTNLTSSQAANNLATAIINKLNTQYPVYAPAGSNPQVAFAINSSTPSTNTAYGNSRTLSYVQLSGVDLDVEVANASQMATIAPYIVQVLNAVHTALPNKTLSVAVFSVGGDPANQCTVPGSQHCGEALPLINAINANANLKNSVYYNVMAYDAGTDFVLPTSTNGGHPLYETALQNYTNAVGNPQQVILGLDLQIQWGLGTSMTCAQLSSQAQWAYQHPNVTGGTFLWEIGDDSNNCKALPALQSMTAALPK